MLKSIFHLLEDGQPMSVAHKQLRPTSQAESTPYKSFHPVMAQGCWVFCISCGEEYEPENPTSLCPTCTNPNVVKNKWDLYQPFPFLLALQEMY